MKRISTLILSLVALLMLSQTAGAQDYDVEVATIAAFNATEDGKVVKLTLTNAQVNANNYGTYYVEDATGATAIKGTALTVGTKLNGYIVGTKGTEDVDYVNTPSQGLEYSLTVSNVSLSSFEATATDLVATEMTIAEAATQANYGRLVTLHDVTITAIGNGRNKELADGEGNTMRTRDIFGVFPENYEWPTSAQKITGLLLFYTNGWYLIPLSTDAIVSGELEIPTVAEFDFLNNNLDLPIGNAENANAGNLGGKSVTHGDVTISFVNSSTMPTRYYFNAGKNQLQVIAGGQLRFTAAAGSAITKIEIIPVAASNNKWDVDGDVGTLSEDKLTWEGNTTTVRFTATGALYLTNIVVTTEVADAGTITPADNEEYVEVASLAEFNALAKGTLVKLNLTDAVVTSGMVNDWGYYVQDATAGAHFYCTGLDFEVNDALNGYVYAKKDFNQPGPRIAMTEKTNAENLTVTHNATYAPIEGTLAEVVKAANNNRVVKLTGVTVKGTAETEAIITSGEETLAISNGKTNYAPYVYQEDLTNIDYSSATIVGILWSNTAGNTYKLYPLSITEGSGTGIETVNAANADNVNIYNLQGVRLNQLQRGLNIVNGRKVMMK